MKSGTVVLLLSLVSLAGLSAPARAQDKPVVAVIGTGNFAGAIGPALAKAGYTVVYGSRTPARDSVRALVTRTGTKASATTPPQAVARAQIVVLAVPGEVLEEVSAPLGLGGKIVLDVSGGKKRVAADGYLELVSDSSYAERIQSRHRAAHVVRIYLPSIFFIMNPQLTGTTPSVPIAGNNPRAREAVARLIFDVGLEPHDSGPLRFSRVFDALGMLSLVPLQQGRAENYDLKFLQSTPWSCLFDASAAFGFGRPYDLDSLPKVPRREPVISCDEWRRRLKF
jgi:8-hydroxy-5-deazaflavin:NADPH oxidoreductase